MGLLITSKQCKKARNLLKWNLHDVSSRCMLRTDRIDKFERNVLRITRPENDTLVKLYKEHGIAFKENYEVILSTSKSADTKKSDKAVATKATMGSARPSANPLSKATYKNPTNIKRNLTNPLEVKPQYPPTEAQTTALPSHPETIDNDTQDDKK